MPWTIWRYTLTELWRLIALSTAVMVAVIAAAFTVKPLAEGDLDPASALRFMALAVPPTLAYALPFAASFASTLAYHRMAQDNEILAALAGGVSHRKLILPALASGLFITAALAALSDQVIPRFLGTLERMVTRDLAQIFVRQIQRGEAATLDNISIYAQAVADHGPDPSGGALERLVLSGVAAIELDSKGRVATDVTSERALIELRDAASMGMPDASVAAVITFENMRLAGEGDRVSVRRLPIDPIAVPDAFEDDPKFLTGGQLTLLRRSPQSMSFIASRRWTLARELATAQSGAFMADTLAAGAPLQLHSPADARVELRDAAITPDAAGWALSPSPGRTAIQIERITPSDSGQRQIEFIAADSARLDPVARSAEPLAAAAGDRLEFELTLRGVVLRTPASRREIARPDLSIDGLTLPDDPMPAYLRADPAALAALAQPWADSDPRVARARDDLLARLARLDREIIAKRHERIAIPAAALLMLVTGALTALRLHGGRPLVVYLWSFVPAVVTLLLISTGAEHMERVGLAGGLPVLWSGLALLAVYATTLLAAISRH